MSDSSLTAINDAHTLYSDHYRWLNSWLRRRTGCSEQAADVAQDTFVRLMSRREPTLLTQPRAYLVTIAKGLLANRYQRQLLEQAYLEALAALPEPEAPSPERRLLILETLYEIDAMLDRLPAKAKRAFLLSQIGAMKYEDVAREIGVSLPSVKRYMKQAFALCLSLMDE